MPRHLHEIPRNVDRRLSQLLLRTAHLFRRVNHEQLEEVGATWLQYLALARVDERPGVTAATLARLSGVQRQTMQNLVLSLEQAHYVWRPEDRAERRRPVLLTDEGRTFLERGHAVSAGIERYMFSGLTFEEAGKLDKCLGSCLWSLLHGSGYEFDPEMQASAGWLRRYADGDERRRETRGLGRW